MFLPSQREFYPKGVFTEVNSRSTEVLYISTLNIYITNNKTLTRVYNNLIFFFVKFLILNQFFGLINQLILKNQWESLHACNFTLTAKSGVTEKIPRGGIFSLFIPPNLIRCIYKIRCLTINIL